MTINPYFAHPENALIAMLADEGFRVRQLGVNKIRRGKEDTVIESDNFEGGFIDQDPPSGSTSLTQHTSTVHKFLLPKLNFVVKSFYKLVNLTGHFIHLLPVTQHLTDKEIEDILSSTLILNHTCHKQQVEQHIKLFQKLPCQLLALRKEMAYLSEA